MREKLLQLVSSHSPKLLFITCITYKQNKLEGKINPKDFQKYAHFLNYFSFVPLAALASDHIQLLCLQAKGFVCFIFTWDSFTPSYYPHVNFIDIYR